MTAQSNLADRILSIVTFELENHEYITVRQVSKTLGIKQTEVKDNLPEGYRLIPSQNGTLSESRIVAGSDEVIVTGEVAPPKSKPRKEVAKVQEQMDGQDVDPEDVEGTEREPGDIDENTGEKVPAAELAVCTVCGNKVRQTTMTRRGICPLCFRQLVKNSGQTSKTIMDLSDEDFEAIVGKELGNRRSQEDYKTSRILTPEEFESRKAGLVPVKEVFAAAKEAGFGPGRTAQAMGGDRFRHEPLGGFGSVWTPYFSGGRKAWYFDKDILNHLQELAKPEKPPKEKKERAPRKDADGNPISRTGARGQAMTVVKKKDAKQEAEPESEGELVI